MDGILHRDVTEDRVREYLRATGGEKVYTDDEAGSALLDRDVESVMEASRQHGQWLNSLDPLSRMQAEQRPFLSAPAEEATDDTDDTDSGEDHRSHRRHHHGSDL